MGSDIVGQYPTPPVPGADDSRCVHDIWPTIEFSRLGGHSWCYPRTVVGVVPSPLPHIGSLSLLRPLL